MNKLTKIIATIGPACESEEMIEKMIEAGVDVFRFNFKHADISWHEERIKRVNKIAEKLKKHIGILLDLQGPEIRVKLPYEEIIVEKGELYPFGDVIFKKNLKGISISYSSIIESLNGGEKVLIEDGYYEFEVIKKNNDYFLLSKQDGIIKNKKNFNILGVDLPFSCLVEKDLKGLEMAVRNEVDFIALSFVRKKDDILILKKEMEKFNLKAKVIAKIETSEALKNIEEIIQLVDGVMVARGDLGVELSMEKVPYYQKLLIEKAREKNKFVITATQMLQSMISTKIPTRAEVSDIANACYDKTDAVMLSGETATGNFPLEAVMMMKKVIVFNENKFDFISRTFEDILDEKEELIAKMVVDLAKNQRKLRDKIIDAILVFTESGKTARLISANRPDIPIIAFVPEKEIADSLTINYGIYPLVYSEDFGREINLSSINKAISYFIKIFKSDFKIKNLLIIHGDYWRVKGKISTLRFYTLSPQVY